MVRHPSWIPGRGSPNATVKVSVALCYHNERHGTPQAHAATAGGGGGVGREDHPAETSLGISSPGCRHRGPPLTVDAHAVLEGSIPFILQQDNQATPFSDAQRTNKPWEKIPWGRMAFPEGLLNCWAWVLSVA